MRISFAAPIALFIAAPALAQGPAWHVSEVSGDVRIVENGRAHPAARGALVPAGAIVATAAGARAVLVRAHDYVVVSPASRIRVPTVQQQGGSGLIQMITDAGTALFRIQHQQVPHFGVQTPYLAAVVKGTVFTVTVGERAASVQVTEGAVQVSTVDGGAADMIRPGMVATIRAADLQLLHVDGETSRDLRSRGAPSAGVVTVPASEAGRYQGPAETPVGVSAPVAEAPVSLADATGGLLGGTNSAARVLADSHDGSRAGTGGGSAAGHAGDDSGHAGGSGNSGNGNGGNGNSGNGNSGSANGGNVNGDGNSGRGNGSDDNSSAGKGNGGHHGHDDPPPPPGHDAPPPHGDPAPPPHGHDDAPPPGHGHDDPPPPPGHGHDDPPPPPGHDDPPPPPGHGHDDPPPPPGHDDPPPGHDGGDDSGGGNSGPGHGGDKSDGGNDGGHGGGHGPRP